MTLPDTRGRGFRQSNSPQYAYVAPLAVLRVRRGGPIGLRLSVRRSMTTIGSGDQADLLIADPSLADLHARLDLRQGIWTLTTLGSGASAQVDGEAVQGDTPLSPGSTIQLGDVLLLFEPLDQTEAERARRSARGESPGAAPPAPRSRSEVGFVLAVGFGVLLLVVGMALEFLS